jgi:class 3 adenylate cyclase/tetratricopeptide (TPR) repeat protein
MTETVLTTAAMAPIEPASELRTFLFADVRGYTRFTQERGDEAAAALVQKFLRLMREGVEARGGEVVEIVGDEAMAVFGSARQALRAAVDLQARFARETDKEPALPLPVGIGLDAGEAVPLEGGYRGEALNLASRLCNLAGAGEILASEGVVYLGRRVQGVTYAERGLVPLKGFVEPVRVIRVMRGDPSVAGADVLSAQAIVRVESMLPIGGFLGALPSGVLVGREPEWEQIMAALDEVSKGSGRLVLLSGEPGIGKTRLAQEVTLKARHWGFLVATGRCYEPEQAVPYYPFLEALTTIYHASPTAMQVEIPRRFPHLARLLPEQSAAPEPSAEMNGDKPDLEDQQRLFRAVTHMLETLALSTPIALLLDDLHWADDSTLKLLQHLARYLRGSRVLLLGTYRDVEVNRQHPLEPALLDLSREGLVEEVQVRRLSPEGTAELMSEIMGENQDLTALAHLLYRRTDGNAFFIQEMLRALVESGDVYRMDGRWELRRIKEMEIPKSIRSLIGQRLSRLEEQAQEILREASVLGQEFSFDDLQALITMAPRAYSTGREADARSEDAIDSALEQAIVSGLVRETRPEHYEFNHALTQQTLYAELSTRRRKRLHLAAGQGLLRLTEKQRVRRAAELEWHFLEGDDAEQALPFALTAGDQAEAVYANGDAERHYRTALELAGEVGDTEKQVEALEKLADVLATVARFDNALDLLEQAVRIFRKRGDREGEALAVAQMGHVHMARSTRSEGVARLTPLIDELETECGQGSASCGLAALWAALARLYQSGDSDRQLEAAERALELATQLGDDGLIISAEVSRSHALWELGQEDEALRVLEDVIPRAQDAGDMHTLARALNNTGVYYQRRGDLDKDRVYHERALEIHERRGDRGQIISGSMVLSMNAFLVGNWSQARQYLDRADEVLESLGSTGLATWPTAARGWMALREGDLEAAERYAEEAAQLANSAGGEWRRLVARLGAEIALRRGDPAEALARLQPWLAESSWRDDASFLETLAWVHLENGDIDDAARLIAEGIELARKYKYRTDLPSVLVMAGVVMTKQRQWKEANRYLDEALTMTREMHMPFEEARALLALGSLLRLQGQGEEARYALEQALGIFGRLGARLDEERAAEELTLVGEG